MNSIGKILLSEWALRFEIPHKRHQKLELQVIFVPLFGCWFLRCERAECPPAKAWSKMKTPQHFTRWWWKFQSWKRMLNGMGARGEEAHLKSLADRLLGAIDFRR